MSKWKPARRHQEPEAEALPLLDIGSERHLPRGCSQSELVSAILQPGDRPQPYGHDGPSDQSYQFNGSDSCRYFFSDSTLLDRDLHGFLRTYQLPNHITPMASVSPSSMAFRIAYGLRGSCSPLAEAFLIQRDVIGLAPILTSRVGRAGNFRGGLLCLPCPLAGLRDRRTSWCLAAMPYFTLQPQRYPFAS